MGRILTGTVTTEGGTPVAYWRSGKGPPLVLVHGTAADHSRWSPVLPALEERFTVYAIDRRGRGGSGDTDDYAVEREFEDVAAVVNSLGGGGGPGAVGLPPRRHGRGRALGNGYRNRPLHGRDP